MQPVEPMDREQVDQPQHEVLRHEVPRDVEHHPAPGVRGPVGDPAQRRLGAERRQGAQAVEAPGGSAGGEFGAVGGDVDPIPLLPEPGIVGRVPYEAVVERDGSPEHGHLAGPRNHHVGHPFTAPAIIPEDTRRWSTRKTSRTGSMNNVAAAMVAPQSVPKTLPNPDSQIGSVRSP